MGRGGTWGGTRDSVWPEGEARCDLPRGVGPEHNCGSRRSLPSGRERPPGFCHNVSLDLVFTSLITT